MLFNSFDFLLFFLFATLSYFLLPHRFRWLLLLFASCYFYMAFVPVYILILFGTIVIDYVAGIIIENTEGRKRKVFLIASIAANIGVLAAFKYYNFFAVNINEVVMHVGSYQLPLLKILLPIGLSFHTFQAMSYTIEVYRGNQMAERHFGIYALYVMFYPQLVAGPIERPQNIIHQFHERHTFQWGALHLGLKKMLWGFFKKIVIADRLALVVGNVYDHPTGHSGAEIVIATVFFSFQIYCDFSGYSDIAIGVAEIMGFKLMTNFNKPYFSSSISEFWKRWHISLSTWFRDYLYIPLGGNRVPKGRVYVNMFIVFLVSGFWHGANWTFIIWGALHGCYLIAEILTKKISNEKKRGREPRSGSGVVFTFILVAFAWIFFRAASVSDALYLISHIGSGWGITSPAFYRDVVATLGGNDTIYGLFNLVSGSLLIACLLFMERISNTNYPLEWFDTKSYIVRQAVYIGLVVMILVIGVYENKEFIYFQF